MMTPMARTIMKAAQDLGYDWKKLDKFMYQDRWQPQVKFGYYGDPHRVKWSARMFAEEAVNNGAVLLNKAKVSTGHFRRRYGHRRGIQDEGKAIQVFAPKIVTRRGRDWFGRNPSRQRREGSGIRVLLRSAYLGMRESQDARKRINEIPMSAGCLMADEGYVMTDMALPTMIDKMFALEVFRFWRLFEARKTLRIMIKARDDLSGRLTDGGGVRKALTKNDKAKLMKGYERAKRF